MRHAGVNVMLGHNGVDQAWCLVRLPVPKAPVPRKLVAKITELERVDADVVQESRSHPAQAEIK